MLTMILTVTVLLTDINIVKTTSIIQEFRTTVDHIYALKNRIHTRNHIAICNKKTTVIFI